MNMHIVRVMKTYNHVRVANAMGACGYGWKNPRNMPRNIERMVEGIPRCDLLRILRRLQQST